MRTKSPGWTTLNKKVISSMLLVLILITSGLTACSSSSNQTDNVNQADPGRALPAEQPELTQRAQSPTIVTVSTRGSGPWGIALDEAHGYVWVAQPGCDPKPPCASAFPTKISKFSLADGSFIQDFTEPAQYSNPFFLAVNRSDGSVWFSEPNSDAIGELSPDDNRFQQWPTTRGSTPYDLLFDKNGNLWFTEYNSSSIGFMNTKTHKIVETATPTAGTEPYGITLDPKGNIWFAENAKGIAQIGMFTPTPTGNISIKEFPIDATLISQPHLITAAPNGQIWISEGFLGNITDFDPATGSVTHYKVASTTNFTTSVPCRRPPDNCTHISGIAADKNDNIWFTDSLNATVGYFVPSKDRAYIQPLIDPNAHPHDGLAVQSNGTVWFTEQFGSQIKGDLVQGPALVMWPNGTLKG
jgi:streptogramin lyase